MSSAAEVPVQTSQRRWEFPVLRAYLKSPVAVIGAGFVLLWVLAAIFAPLVSPYDPNTPDISARLVAPNAAHWFGTDNFGRDVLSRVIWGGRMTLQASAVGVLTSGVVGVVLGAIAGYFKGWPREVIMRLMDVLLAFPSLILAMGIAAALGPGLTSAVIAVGVVGIPEFARIMYGLTLSLKEQEYVEAARAAGLASPSIMFRHILPNAFGSLLVRITLGLGMAALTTASLSFIGLGAQPPTAEWGLMISASRAYILTGQWWMTLFPGIALGTTILGFNLSGDGLRDALDPKLRHSARSTSRGSSPATNIKEGIPNEDDD